jgi:Zn-dependent protease with chaperone function
MDGGIDMKEGHSPPNKRLNPFAFTPETNFRFTLLLIAAFAIIFEFSILFNASFSIEPGLGNIDSQASAEQTTAQYFEQVRQQASQEIFSLLRYISIPAGLLVLIGGSAIWVYRRHPERIRRQKQIPPLDSRKDADILTEVQDMSRIAGLPGAPEVEINSGLKGQSGQAYGLPGHYRIRLDGGMRLLKRKAYPSFRAIVLHEMGHIANRDIGRTYFTQALWSVLVLLVFIPLGLLMGIFFAQGIFTRIQGGFSFDDFTHVLTLNLPALALFILRLGFIVYLVALIRASILRVREVYADWRTVTWGEEQGLLAVLNSNAVSEPKSPKRNWLRLHPSFRERIETIKDPGRLFRLALDLPFVTGILLAFLFSGVVIFATFGMTGLLGLSKFVGSFLTVLTQDLSDPVAIPLLRMILLGIGLVMAMVVIIPFILAAIQVYILYGAIGLQVQQEAIAEMSAGTANWRGHARLLLPSFLLASGFQVGMLVLPDTPFIPRSLGVWGFVLLWMLAATGLTWICLVYARFLGRQILGRDTGYAAPRGKRRWLTLILGSVFLIAYLPLFAGQLSFLGVSSAPIDPFNLGFLETLTLLLLVVALLVVGFVFMATLFFVALKKWISPLRCPACQRKSVHRYAVGQVCENCGSDLAPWIYYRPVKTGVDSPEAIHQIATAAQISRQ